MRKFNFSILFLSGIFVSFYELSILENAYNSFLVAICAMVLVHYINTTIHEFGHLFFSILTGCEFRAFSVGSISIENINNKLKFRFRTNQFSGYCSIIPKSSDIKKHLLNTSGGFIFNLITSITAFIALKYFDVGNYKAFVLVILISSIYMVISNGIPYLLGDNTDGTIIYNILFKDNFVEAWTELLNVKLSLNEGIRPREIVGELSYKDLDNNLLRFPTCLYSYYRALDKGDFKRVEQAIKFLEDNLDNLPLRKNSYLSEFIYYYSVIEIDLVKARKYFEICKKDLEKDMDINGRRSMAVYYYYVLEEKESAKKYCDYGLNVFSEFPYKGQALLERDIIEKILYEIQ